MSKQRARRRAEREALAERQRAARARVAARRARRRALLAALRRPLAPLIRGRRRPDSSLRRMRARQDAALASAVLAGNGLLWLFEPSWVLRGAVAVVSTLAWPVLVVLVFDSRRRT
ncbi:MAG TPA: hypothetical protein VI248_12005 [Kineosporiaceae bacterium]